MLFPARAVSIFALGLAPFCAVADPVVDRVVDTVVLPAVGELEEATDILANVARSDCRATNPALLEAWNAAMDAWIGVQDFRFGPLETGAQRQAIAYWPDSSGSRPRVLSKILTGANPILDTPENYGQESVAARGLFALEAMLYDPAFSGYGTDDPGCALVKAATADLANVARGVAIEWRDDFADVLRSAGEPGNNRFLDATEARQAIFTALMTSMQFDVLERLGLPLGTFQKPRPLRAEGRISGRSKRNLELSLAAHDALAMALVPDVSQNLVTREDFERLRWMASRLDDPDFSGVSDPISRFRIEALQTALSLLRTAANQELSAALGVTMGLNALDGD